MNECFNENNIRIWALSTYVSESHEVMAFFRTIILIFKHPCPNYFTNPGKYYKKFNLSTPPKNYTIIKIIKNLIEQNSNITIFCIQENKNIRDLSWSYSRYSSTALLSSRNLRLIIFVSELTQSIFIFSIVTLFVFLNNLSSSLIDILVLHP